MIKVLLGSVSSSALLSLGSLLPTPTPATMPIVTAPYFLVEPANGNGTFYEKDRKTRFNPASVIKLLTAAVLFDEKSSVLSTETLTVQTSDLVSGSSAGLAAGDICTLEQALHFMLLPSGNEAAEAIARHVGNDLPGAGSARNKFLTAMSNLLALEGHSGFTVSNPGGGGGEGTNSLSAEECLSIGRIFYRRPQLHTTQLSSYSANVTGSNPRTITVSFTHLLNNRTDFIFGKTGTNDSNGSSLLTCLKMPNGEDVIYLCGESSANFNRYYDTTAVIFDTTGVGHKTRFSQKLIDGTSGTVILKLPFDVNANDVSSIGRVGTLNSGATINTANPSIGSGSLAPGNTGWASYPDTNDLSMGSVDFTIEFFLRGNGTTPTSETSFIGKYDFTTNNREWIVIFSGSSVSAFVSSNGSIRNSCSQGIDTAFFNGATRHIAFQREGSLFTIFLNGIRGIASSLNWPVTLHSSASNLRIGANQSGSNNFNGRIDGVRITRGFARYPLSIAPQCATIHALEME